MNVLLLSLLVSASPNGLTVAEAARLAVARDPGLAASAAGASEAEAGVEVAYSQVLPRVSLEARYTRLSRIDNDPLVDLSIDLDAARAGVQQIADPATRAVLGAQIEQLAGLSGASIDIPRNQYGASVEIVYPVSDLFLEILPAIDSAESGADAQAFLRDAVRLQVGARAGEALLGHLNAVEARSVAERSVEAAETAAAAAQARLDAGMGNRPDLLRFQARLAAAKGALAEAGAEVERTAAVVRVLCGLDTSPQLGVGIDDPVPRLGEAIAERALAERPEVKAAEAAIAAARARFRQVSGAMAPELLGAARFDAANPNRLFTPPGDELRTSWSLSAVVQWSPDAAWRASRQAAGAEAAVARAEAEAEAVRDGIRIEVAAARARLDAARARVEASLRGLEAASEAERAVSKSYELGLADATDLIEAQLAREQADLDRVAAAVGLRIRYLRLLTATGVFVGEA